MQSIIDFSINKCQTVKYIWALWHSLLHSVIEHGSFYCAMLC